MYNRVLPIVLVLGTLAQCNVISEAEVERRIKNALPEADYVNIVYLRSTFVCIYAIAEISSSGDFLERAQKRNRTVKDTKTLGENWWKVTSMANFADRKFESLFEGLQLPNLGAALLDTRDCAPDEETYWKYINDTMGYISVYPDTDEFVLVNGDNLDRVVYFAAGT